MTRQIAWGDVASWVSGLATSVALIFAVWQVRQLRKRDMRDRRVELEGVAVSWRAPKVPRSSDVEGMADWTYLFTAHNPGRLPITNVKVVVTFPMDVQRKHFDGHAEEPSRELLLTTPVIAGISTRSWTRIIRLELERRNRLTRTTATISFRDPDGTTRTNPWPAAQGGAE